MSDYGTFSSIVDTVVARSNRPDRKDDITSYVRTTIRECTVQAFFKQDFQELSVTVAALQFVWVVPEYFRQLAFAQTPYYRHDGQPIFAKEKSPANVKSEDTYWYYRAGDSYVFANLGIGDIIKLGYYKYGRKFFYRATETDRPARYDLETGVWSYHANYAATALLQETARDLVTNWLLFNWTDTLIEGGLAKVYKSVNDPRAGSTYGLYKQLQKDLLAGEANVAVLD